MWDAVSEVCVLIAAVFRSTATWRYDCCYGVTDLFFQNDHLQLSNRRIEKKKTHERKERSKSWVTIIQLTLIHTIT